VFEVRDVHVAYGSVTALRGISLEVREGEIVCLLGANGAGKSTTLRTVSGLLHPLRGEVLLRGHPIHRLSAEAIAKRGISHVPEGRRIFPGLTVRENLVLGASNRPMRRQELDDDMAQVFHIFPDLERLKHALGWTLSGGQQQMLAFAQGLAARPTFLLADEMSLGLAPLVVRRLMQAVERIVSEGIGVLLIEQFTPVALRLADRAYVINRGRIRFDGASAELRANPAVLHDAYLAAGA